MNFEILLLILLILLFILTLIVLYCDTQAQKFNNNLRRLSDLYD